MEQNLNRNLTFVSNVPINKLPEMTSFECDVNSDIFKHMEAASFECDVNSDIFKQIPGIDLSNNRDMSCSMKLLSPYQIQKRKHKKRRINKKWAKKYGYITKYTHIIVENCSIVPRTCGVDIIFGNYIRV